jgi:hypothetical protein
MAEYSTDPAERAERRASIRSRVMQRAEVEVMRSGRTIACGEQGRHIGDLRGGCKGGPARCICECHDPGGET